MSKTKERKIIINLIRAMPCVRLFSGIMKHDTSYASCSFHDASVL